MDALEEMSINPIEQHNEEVELQKKRKTQKKLFINEDLFGKSRTFEDSPPEEGIAHLKIRAKELGNIPGLIEHWDMEIKNRVAEIQIWNRQTFLQKASKLFHGEMLSETASGMEIAKLHPTRAALEKVRRLKRKPTDMMSRLELVSIVAKSGRDFPIETYRTFLLQAVVACSFGEYSTLGLLMVIWVQDHYFSKLYYLCNGEALALESKLESKEGKENAFTRQSIGLRQHIGEVKRNMEIIKSYQKQSTKASQENNSAFNTTLSLDEIDSFLLSAGEKLEQNDKKRNEKRVNILKKSSQILLLLRVIPLLYPQAIKLSERLKKMDQNDPVAHFLEGKVNMSDLILKVNMYQGGERTDKVRSEIQDIFKKVLHQYGISVKKVGKLPKAKMEFTIFIEYASLIHYFYKIAKTTLGLRLPHEWLKSVFLKAVHLLELSQEKGQVGPLMRDLQRDMAEEGIDGPITHQ